MSRRKSIESYEEDIQKAQDKIEDLKEKLREERAVLKALEEGKRAEQGTILLQKFWDQGIKDFDQVESAVEKIAKENNLNNEDGNTKNGNEGRENL